MQQINLDKNVSIEFTPDQIGYVLNVLRKQAYEQVADLIPSIQSQILDQVNPVKQMKKATELTAENGIEATT